MAWNEELLQASRNVIEPYAAYSIKLRPNVTNVRHTTEIEDKKQKIDLMVETINYIFCPVQVKTRQIDSDNFSLSLKDIIADQANRVFCFIDKTFSPDVVNIINEMDSKDAIQMLKDERIPILLINQNKIIENLHTFKTYTKNNNTYYLIPKSIM